jgi:hypothetical protein
MSAIRSLLTQGWDSQWRELKVWSPIRGREMPATGYALEVNRKLKAAFAIRDGATAVEEAVKTFPNASGSNL